MKKASFRIDHLEGRKKKEHFIHKEFIDPRPRKWKVVCIKQQVWVSGGFVKRVMEFDI